MNQLLHTLNSCMRTLMLARKDDGRQPGLFVTGGCPNQKEIMCKAQSPQPSCSSPYEHLEGKAFCLRQEEGREIIPVPASFLNICERGKEVVVKGKGGTVSNRSAV